LRFNSEKEILAIMKTNARINLQYSEDRTVVIKIAYEGKNLPLASLYASDFRAFVNRLVQELNDNGIPYKIYFLNGEEAELRKMSKLEYKRYLDNKIDGVIVLPSEVLQVCDSIGVRYKLLKFNNNLVSLELYRNGVPLRLDFDLSKVLTKKSLYRLLVKFDRGYDHEQAFM
jgi:hypothetical protein